jgi:hypothetical protein
MPSRSRPKPPTNANPEVDAFIKDLGHPLEGVMQAVRLAILATDPRMTEVIKWKSPTFTYEGNLASINPRAKAHVSLMFHTGADIPGDFPHLDGGEKVARYMRFPDLATVDQLRPELESIVSAWIELKTP